MKVKCKVCGKTYPDKPEKCEYDGLDDFENIAEKIDNQYFSIVFDNKLIEIPLSELPVDISKIDILGKVSFPFNPAGSVFSIRLPGTVLFKDNDMVIRNSEKKDTLVIDVRKSALKCSAKVKRQGEDNYQPIAIDKDTEPENHIFYLSLYDHITINGLNLNYNKK